MRLLICCLFILFLGSCSPDSFPSDILKTSEMKSVVWDIMLADQLALQNTQSDPKLNLKNESFRLYSQVFSIHKISSKQYFKSYRYYQEHPALYKDLMLQVKQLAEKDKNVPQQKLH